MPSCWFPVISEPLARLSPRWTDSPVLMCGMYCRINISAPTIVASHNCANQFTFYFGNEIDYDSVPCLCRKTIVRKLWSSHPFSLDKSSCTFSTPLLQGREWKNLETKQIGGESGIRTRNFDTKNRLTYVLACYVCVPANSSNLTWGSCWTCRAEARSWL